MNDIQLSNLVNPDSPDAVFGEVEAILKLVFPRLDMVPITSAFTTAVDMYNGKYPGYKACTTEYHDLRHNLNVFLTMARLLHGALLDGKELIGRDVSVSLIAAIFHDVGYIQEEWETEGTGGKHTLNAVRRSADFLERYGEKNGMSQADIAMGQSMILCTKIASNIDPLIPPDNKTEFLGRMLCVAVLKAQMSDRAYLEKLLLLYHEVKECSLSLTFENEVDLLRKTAHFYEFTAQYIKMILEENELFLKLHFSSRWGIRKNLYQEAIDRQKKYLNQILNMPGADPRDYLKRRGIVKKVREKYGADI